MPVVVAKVRGFIVYGMEFDNAAHGITFDQNYTKWSRGWGSSGRWGIKEVMWNQWVVGDQEDSGGSRGGGVLGDWGLWVGVWGVVG